MRGNDLLHALFAMGVERGIPRFCIASLGEQIRLHALFKRADTCQALWVRLDAIVPVVAREQRGLLGPELALMVGIAAVYLALAKQDWPSMLAVVADVSALAERLRRGREIVQLKLLRAFALEASGGKGDSGFMEALSLVQEFDLQRVVEETHPDLLQWQQTNQSPVGLSSQPTNSDAVVREDYGTSTVSPSRLLTPKEQQVLRLLARDLSNKQIGLALNVGEETVKWHMKNLFGKFQAGTRKHVVARAYMLGILEKTN